MRKKDYVSGEPGNKNRHYTGGSAQIISESGEVYNIPKNALKPPKPVKRPTKPKQGLKRIPNLLALELNTIDSEAALGIYPNSKTDRILNELVTNPRKYRKGDADISH